MARIQISGNVDEDILSITLRQILECIEKEKANTFKWKILWFEGVANIGETIFQFEEKINKSQNGILYNFQELLNLSDNLSQLIEILIIGSREENKLIKYAEEIDMYNSCEYVIELIDGSYWEFSSYETESISKIKFSLKGVKDIL